MPKAIANSMFPIPNIPSAKWPLCNRTLLFFQEHTMLADLSSGTKQEDM
ncbi:MAG: hypothetical protein ACMUJM_15580 [bacterium]